MINKKYIQAKKAIRKDPFAGVFTASMYKCSPYHACEHGCIYCDGRAEKYYVEGEFDKDIVIRQNIAELLKIELPRLRERACNNWFRSDRCLSAGLTVGVLLMPLLPWISDTDENLIPLLVKLRELDVDFVIPGNLTLRPGKQKELYFHTIREHFPHLISAYEDLYQKNLVSGNPIYKYRKNFYKRVPLLLKGLNPLVPQYLFQNRMPVYNEILILLSHMVELYSIKEVNTDRLKKSLSLYMVWVENEKKMFNSRRSLPADYIDEKLHSLIAIGEFDNLIKNEKLGIFLTKVISKRYIFNYHTFKLEKPT